MNIKIISTSKDLRRVLNWASLWIYMIFHEGSKDPDRVVNKAQSIAMKMTQLHKAIDILDKLISQIMVEAVKAMI